MGATASIVSATSVLRGSQSQKKVSRQAIWRLDNKFKEHGNYLPLYKAALDGSWKDAKTFLDEEDETLSAKITITSETTLHIAVGTGKAIGFVENLVNRMTPEELALTDQNGDTALSVAATVGNTAAAQLLVSKNPTLPNIAGKSGFPIHRAAQYGHRDMILYLLAVTRNDIECSPFSGESGVKLVISAIYAEFYDIAVHLVEQYPDVATMEQSDLGSPLSVLAEMPTAFPSEYRHLSFWDSLLRPFAYFKDVKSAKLRHYYAHELLKCLCREIAELDDADALLMFRRPLHLAAKLGIHEIVEEIVEVFPPAIWSSDEENRNIFQLAVMYRQQNVFNLIYQMSNFKYLVTRYIDTHGNNILHLAGELPPLGRLNRVPGAALQMQREMQWFKEVENLVQPAYKVCKNAKGETPAFVFSKAHEELVKEGEKWMKETATSCTVVAALIATVVFTAAISVPGGNDQDNGVPLFIKKEQHQLKAFAIFGIFDGISLFSSVTSILMFLSILTSRYSEADFLRSLPKRLVIGLSSLFISITSLMVASGAAFYLVFGEKKPWMLRLVCGSASVPVTLFIFLQFRLLVDITRATYGLGIFHKRSHRMLH